MECTGTNNSICFGVCFRDSFISHAIVKIDFSSLATVSYKYYSNSSIVLTSVSVIDEHQVIGSGFDYTNSVHEHIFFRLNYSSSSYDWSIKSPPFGK